MQRKKSRRLKKKYKRLFLFCFLGLFFLSGRLVFMSFKEVEGKEIKKEEKTTQIIEPFFPENVYGIPVKTELIAKSNARPMIKREIKYIVIHETDNEELGAGAHNHSIFLSENNTSPTSWHYTVDDTEIYHHIPDDEIAYHAGEKEGNQFGIGIELCVNKDGDFKKTIENAAKLVAVLLEKYHLTIDDVKTHHDFSGKDCPHQILKNNRLEDFKKKVKTYLNGEE